MANIFDSTLAYIYLWISKKSRAVYVGQTSGDGGVISRAGAHVKSAGTLRARYFDAYGECLETADDWKLISCRLPKEKKFTGAESSFRNAVEYLVQVKLNEVRSKYNPPFRLISNVTYSDNCTYAVIQELAEKIIEEFQKNYNEL